MLWWKTWSSAWDEPRNVLHTLDSLVGLGGSCCCVGRGRVSSRSTEPLLTILISWSNILSSFFPRKLDLLRDCVEAFEPRPCLMVNNFCYDLSLKFFVSYLKLWLCSNWSFIGLFLIYEFLLEVIDLRSDSKPFWRHLFAVAVAGPPRESLLFDFAILSDFLLVMNRYSSLEMDLCSLTTDSLKDYFGGAANVRVFFCWLWQFSPTRWPWLSLLSYNPYPAFCCLRLKT